MIYGFLKYVISLDKTQRKVWINSSSQVYLLLSPSFIYPSIELFSQQAQHTIQNVSSSNYVIYFKFYFILFYFIFNIFFVRLLVKFHHHLLLFQQKQRRAYEVFHCKLIQHGLEGVIVYNYFVTMIWIPLHSIQ